MQSANPITYIRPATPIVHTPTLHETIAVLDELYKSGFGRALPTFDKEREHQARLAAVNLLIRAAESGL